MRYSCLALGLVALLFTFYPHSTRSQSNRVSAKEDLTLWYEQAAQVWTEALPLGNGHLGAMLYGGTTQEHLQLNESTLYSGDPSRTYTSIDIREKYPEVETLLKEERYAEAQKLITQEWLGRNQQSYQPLGDLWIDFDHPEPVTDYTRSLDLATATARIQYKSHETNYAREYFVSYPDRLLVIRLTARGKDKLTCKLRLSTLHTPTAHFFKADNQLVMQGRAPGFVLRRTLDQVQNIHDQHKYPELFAKDGTLLPGAAQVLYGEAADGLGMYFETRIKATNRGGACGSKR